MKKHKSLKRRWFVNTVGVASAIALVLTILTTALFCVVRYSDTVSDMQQRAKNFTVVFGDYLNLDLGEYLDLCKRYTAEFEDSDGMILQLFDPAGQLIAHSDSELAELMSSHADLLDVMETRDIRPFIGKNVQSGSRIIAVSWPVIYSNGEVVGVLRYASTTKSIEGQAALVALGSFIALGLTCAVVMLSCNHYIQSLLVPVAQITEKAKKIAGGTYGMRIETKYDDEIGELAQTINELSARIAQNEKLQTEFISSLSHELRTPLTAITGWSETLIDDESMEPETLRGMKIILREAKRLTEMVVDLLDFTRMQDGRMTLNVEPADIRAEFEDTVFMYSSRAAQDGITLNYIENDDDVPEIICDAKRLRQVFLNILDNAAKHGGEGKRIDATMTFKDGYVFVQIRDFGPGIPEDEIPLVKKKFYKGSSKARGTGIGLAVCDEIVQMHGGELILSNAQGGGTEVVIKLPAAQ